jgi:hypothetical protein
MTPMPLSTMTQPSRHSGPMPDLPLTYVYCTEGKDGEPPLRNLDRIRADPAWRFVELAANHIAHVTAPEKLTATLLDVAV